MKPSPTPIDAEEQPGPLGRFALRMTALSERYLPDAFIFALVGTAIVVALALTAGGSGVGQAVKAWGGGFWSLIPFTLQMAMIVVSGTVVANVELAN